MGRAKLEMKFRENSRVRRATYMTRMAGLKKKAAELSVLCGVDVLVASFSPELNAGSVQFWPENDTVEFRRIKERYIHFRTSEKRSEACGAEGSQNQNIAFQPLPFPSLPSASEEWAAMSFKLAEIRERLSFLGEASSNAAVEDQTPQVMLQATIPFLPSASEEMAAMSFLGEVSSNAPMEEQLVQLMHGMVRKEDQTLQAIVQGTIPSLPSASEEIVDTSFLQEASSNAAMEEQLVQLDLQVMVSSDLEEDVTLQALVHGTLPSLPSASEEIATMMFLGEAASNASMEEQLVQPLQVSISSQLEEDETLQEHDMIPFLHFLTEFPFEDVPSFLLSDSPSRSSMDDLIWCDNLLDYESY